ncbi:aldo/keto reductase [Pedococcus sp. 2YAF34]|uniref:aldo/keto reductase n=1 Tax=Pedococcus sp. 2YAF34 TaxID=3233032 RepID=UPI003F9DF066
MSARLGLGLIGIGRPWPSDDVSVATFGASAGLLRAALDQGVQVLDTAPAYGESEQRLGAFLAALPQQERQELFVATKVGEYWSPSEGGRTSHGLRDTEESVRRSARLLGRIDLLQVHKATVEVLRDPAFVRLLRSLADEHGIDHLGASVKDVESADEALATGVFDHVQLPVNPGVPELAAWARSHAHEVTVLGNRPYGSGRLLGGRSRTELLSYAVEHVGDGVVLTGTTNPDHLAETVRSFEEATRG